MEHYISHYGAPLFERLTEPADTPFTERVRSYMIGIIDLINSKESPKGCLFVKSCCETGSSAIPEDVALSLQDMRKVNEKLLTKAAAAEQKRGLLSETAKPRDIAEFLLAVLYGLSVLAKQDKSRNELIRVVDMAVKALPVPQR